jgi:hypothetical protein
LAPPGNALLDQSTAQIRVDQPVACPRYGVEEVRIVDIFATSKSSERFGFVDRHFPPP